MSVSIRKTGMLIVEVILAALLLILMGAFAFQQIMAEITTNQQLSNFYKFRAQVATVCELVKVNPNTLYASPKEYVVLYPFYDIRFYNQTGTMPAEVTAPCKSADRCACLIKTGEAGFIDAHLVCGLSLDYVACIYEKIPLESVLSCFNMQEMGCDNQLWFAKGKEAPMRDYAEGESKTCKSEGVITWDKTGFFYDKLSELCMESG